LINRKAVQCCFRRFDGERGERIVLRDHPQGQAWMVVYWGVGGSEPPRWTIHSVERSEKRIRLYYREEGGNTDDIHSYYAWIPLGNLSVGKYELEMWSQKTGDKTLTRLCWVVERE
jgi:hypothetical protein